MRSITKATYLITTTILCIAPANVAIPFQPVLAAPQQVLINGPKAAYTAPGLGVELEVITLVYETKKAPWDKISAPVKELLKGKEIIPEGFGGLPQTNWKLTAELSPANLITEIIVDGRLNKVNGGQSNVIGEQIVNYMTEWWKRCPEGVECLANVEGDPGETNPWTVRWRHPMDKPGTSFFPQVTTAMPMESVLQILKDSRDRSQDNVLIDPMREFKAKIMVLTEESFHNFKGIRREDITAEFLGFFSLLTNYCVLASDGRPEHGPKRGLNIMPRTNFLTMYNKFAAPKLEAQFKLGTSLYDIVRDVAKLASQDKQDIENMKFNWLAGDLRQEIPETWPGKAADMRSGQLTVKEFLDTLQPLDTPQLDLLMLMDKMVRHGQIGAYGSLMEGVYGRLESPAPIFEFRDIMPVRPQDLAVRMGQFDRQVIALHEIATRHTLDQKEAGPPSKQHNCETETETEKPRQGVTQPKDQSWWLLSFIHHYSGPSKWFPTEL